MDFERKWKVCLMKVPLFLLKNALGPWYKSLYIVFLSYPFGAILDMLPLLRRFIWVLGNYFQKNLFSIRQWSWEWCWAKTSYKSNRFGQHFSPSLISVLNISVLWQKFYFEEKKLHRTYVEPAYPSLPGLCCTHWNIKYIFSITLPPLSKYIVTTSHSLKGWKEVF